MNFALPPNLQDALQTELARWPGAAINQAAATLSAGYRQAAPQIISDAQRTAYLLVRWPATFAAISAVCHELRTRQPDFVPHSLLDLGAGPGTVWWAAQEIFPTLRQATLLERDAGFSRLGQNLLAGTPYEIFWQTADLRRLPPLATHALVTISYVLNELEVAAQTALINSAWVAAGQFLLVIEPGTKAGFANILRARTQLLASGAHIAAPCPHSGVCPLAARADWCHFSQRLPRTAQHRRAKAGALGYEDEKFSYLIAAKTPVIPAPARIVRHPFFGKGHIKLTLCKQETIVTETITAKQKELYKHARKAAWGDGWEQTATIKAEN